MSYRLDFDNVDFWKKKYDEKTKKEYYEKVIESGSLYFRMSDHYYLSDKMLCNCMNYAGEEHENMRLIMNGDYCIIEPSGIEIPIGNLKEISDRSEIKKDKNNAFKDISKNTFICNCISDRLIGGKRRISADEVEAYKKEITDALGKSLDINNFTPFDLVATFSLINYKKRIITFDRDKLIEFIINNKERYPRLLNSINIDRYEHYDSSIDIDKAIDALKYMGMVHPDYSKEETPDYNPYINLKIDESIMYWNKNGIAEELKQLYPEMFWFVDEYNYFNNITTKKANKTSRRRKK